MEEEVEVISLYNKHDTYIPVEYAHIDYERSWKKCRCGHIAKMRENYCAMCGQKLGKPDFDD